MDIQIDMHAMFRAEERGATEDEICDVIRTGDVVPAKRERQGRAKVYCFAQKRNGVFYEEKRVEVYFVEEDGVLIAVTVYVFYGKWES